MRTRTASTTIALFSLAFAGAGVWTGCTDLRTDLPAATTGGPKVHPDGWVTPASSEFHGNVIRANGWDMSSCQSCHSAKFTGGTSGVSCTTCHTEPTGPENCITCHGSSTSPAPPKDIDGNTARSARGVGAHQVHLAGTSTSRQVTCTECHNVPGRVTTAGHVDSALPAEVPLNGMFARWPTTVTPSPTYNPTSLTCSGSYCHGNFTNGNPVNDVVWNGAAGTGAACGSCHGTTSGTNNVLKAFPKTSANGGTHPNNTNCDWCHSATVDNAAKIINATKHVDGTIDLFRITTQADCGHCHGSATNAAPPRDLSKNTAVTFRGVGAHQSHVAALTAQTVRCTECHKVPTTLDYAGTDGHMDATAGAEFMWNDTLASRATIGATPVPAYDSSAVTCSNTYCHGAFTNGNPTNVVTWNGAAGTGAACGTCHGDPNQTTNPLKAMPKNTSNGGTHTTNANCVACHNQTVDVDGNIINPANHINGKANYWGLSEDF